MAASRYRYKGITVVAEIIPATSFLKRLDIIGIMTLRYSVVVTWSLSRKIHTEP